MKRASFYDIPFMIYCQVTTADFLLRILNMNAPTWSINTLTPTTLMALNKIHDASEARMQIARQTDTALLLPISNKINAAMDKMAVIIGNQFP
jgi:hypothetical protein